MQSTNPSASAPHSRIFLTYNPSPKQPADVWGVAGQAISFAHRAPPAIGVAARAIIVLTLTLLAKLSSGGLS
jgi:hypothetical protein